MRDWLRTNLLVIILALSVLVRVGAALYLGDTVEVLPGTHDQISYDALAKNVVVGKGFVFDQAWYPFTPANTPTAHWSFLYPLYLAAVYAVFGYHPLVARLIQAVVVGLLMPWLIYRLGKRFFDHSAAIAAAGMMAFYGYFIYHSAALMTETFYMTMVLGVMNVSYDIVESQKANRWWLLGITMGSAVLLRQVFLFYIPFLLLWMVWAGRERLSRKSLLMATVLVGLFVAPWTIRNYLCYDQFLLLNSNGGYAFYTSNHPAHGQLWNPDFVAVIPEDLAGLNEAKLDQALMSRGIGFVLADPIRFLMLTFSRIPYHFRFWPEPGWRPISNFTRMASFGLTLPLMLVGLILSFHKWRRYLPLYVFCLIFILLHVFSWPGPRYRFPVDALLIIFAGLALSRFINWLCQVVCSRSAKAFYGVRRD